MRARDFILTEDPENIWDPPTPEGLTPEEVLTQIIPVLEEGRARLLAHYQDWYDKEGVPLVWEEGRLFLAKNGASKTLELHTNAPRADAGGLKVFATVLLRDMPYRPSRKTAGPGGGTGYRSRAEPEEEVETGEDVEARTGEVGTGVVEQVFFVPPAEVVKVITRVQGNQVVEILWEMPDGERLSYGEIAARDLEA